MPMELAVKIFEDLRENPYLLHLHFGENGEVNLHPQMCDIIEMFANLPTARLSVASNFGKMDAEKSRRLVDAGVKEVHLNIDGVKETYERFKVGLTFEETMRNLIDLVEYRDSIGSVTPKVKVNIAPLKLWEQWIGHDADHIPDETGDLLKMLKEIFNNSLCGDGATVHTRFGFWRYRCSEVPRNYDFCKIEGRHQDMFVAHNGIVYPCCEDYNQDIVLGDLNTETITQVYTGIKRLTFWTQVSRKQWDAIGYPCSNCIIDHEGFLREGQEWDDVQI